MYVAVMGTAKSKKSAALVAFCLIIGACGGSDGGGGVSSTTPVDADSETTTTLAGQDPTTTSTPGTTTEGPQLTGITWNVTHHDSDIYGGTTNVWPDSVVTLVFADDGTISGTTGCNDYSGTYELSGPYRDEPDQDEEYGQAIVVTVVERTDAACESEELTDQEAEYLAALQQSEFWWIGGGFGGDDQFTLFSPGNGLMVEAEGS